MMPIWRFDSLRNEPAEAPEANPETGAEMPETGEASPGTAAPGNAVAPGILSSPTPPADIVRTEPAPEGTEPAALTVSPAPSETPLPASEAVETAVPETETITAAPSASPEPEEGTRGASNYLLLSAAIIITAAVTCFATLLLVRSANKKRRRRKIAAKAYSELPAEGGIRLSVGNAHAIGRRENQEDAFGVSDISNAPLIAARGVLAVVADGMGGLQKGEEVSAAATASVLHGFPETPPDWSPSQALLYLVEKANSDVCLLVGGEGGKYGSTLIAALVRGNALYFISVGDSRIYLCRGGRLIQLTRPHVYAADLDKRAAMGGMTFAEASADGQRRALTSYIGMGKLEKIDYAMQPVAISSGDSVLLMTDGVFGTLSDKEIAAAVTDDAQESAEAIERAITEKNDPHQDNYTVIVLQFK